MLENYFKARSLRELESRLPEDLDPVRQEVSDFLATDPADPHAMWILARCHVLAEDFDKAQGALEDLLDHEPDNVRAKMDLAKILARDGKTRASIRLLTEVTTARPDIADVWAVLGEQLQAEGQEEAAQDAFKQFSMIKSFNDQLDAARQAFAKADFKTADGMCRHLLRLVPNEIRVLRLLARIADRFQYFEFSTSTLATCIEARPEDAALRLEYANALLRNRKYQEALEQCDKVIELAPEIIDAYDLKAELLYHLGRYDEAIRIYRELAGVQEKRALSLLHLGKVLKTVGEVDEATSCYRQAIELEPGLGRSYWELADLKTYRFSADEVASMRHLLEKDDTPSLDKVMIEFALGKALEDGGDYTESFEHYEAANRGYLEVRPFRYTTQNDRFTSFFTADYFAERKDAGIDTAAPIFVVGMPRSGSTLAEQILSCHSLVDATQELDEIVSIARDIGNPGGTAPGEYPEAMAELTAADVRGLAQRYLDFVSDYRQDAPHFVDKAPHNFQHIGLIKTLLPNAKIVDIRRDPMASGWSLFRQFFADSYLFSYDLETIGKFYNDYVALMDHWHTVLPEQILTVRYEDLVKDLRGVTERILQYCGLEFEEACLDFHLNERAVATPSSEQVRQPLYRDALEHWRNYEPFLGPLKQAIDENARRE